MFLSGPHPPSAMSNLSRRTRVMLDDGFCDSAFGSAQNDRVGIGMSKSFRIRESTKRESGALRFLIVALSTGFV